MDEKEKTGFFEWLKGIGAGLLVWVLRTAVWRILVKVLERAKPEEIADKVRPHLRNLFNKLGPDGQKAITAGIRKVAEFAEELLEDENVTN